jgi:hypothetical protein
MKIAVVFAAALSLTACDTIRQTQIDLDRAINPPRPIYWRQNATNDQLQRDLADCRMRMAMLPTAPQPYQYNPNDPGVVGQAGANAAAAMQDAQNHDAFFSDCMTSKGWQRLSA